MITQIARRGLRFVQNAAAKVERKLPAVHAIDLSGDRAIEWSFVAAHLPPGPGKVLDFGPGNSLLPMVAAQRGHQVTGIDLRAPDVWWRSDAITYLQGDVRNAELPRGAFDAIINCSSIEHVGLTGRYGVSVEAADGDLEAMRTLRGLLRPEGVMLLTLPVGRDSVFRPFHRVYGEERLPKLLEGWTIDREEYWAKLGTPQWELCERKVALDRVPRVDLYGLGCFMLRKE